MKKIVIILLLLYYTCSFAGNPEWMVFDNTNSPIPFLHSNPSIFDIAIQQNDLYLASDKQMLKFNKSNWITFDQKNIPQLNRLREIVTNKSDNLWLINRWDGIIKYNIQNSEIIKYDTTNSPIKYAEISSFCIDSNGVKWFINSSTKNQERLLYRWVGDNWSIFDSSSAFFDHYQTLYKIFVDSKNNKWFSCIDYLVKYTDENWTKYPIDSLLEWGSNLDNVCFAEDSSGNIYFGDRNLLKYDSISWSRLHSYKEISGISTIAVDSANFLWFSAEIDSLLGPRYNLLFKYKNGNYQVWDSTNSPLKPVDGNATWINKIIIDKYGNKLIACSQGFLIFREGGVIGITDVEDDKKMEKDKILCYPNPTEGNITIRYRIEKYSEVNLYISDILGNRIELRKENKFPGDYIEEYNLSHLANGIYFATVNSGTVIYSKQFVIMR